MISSFRRPVMKKNAEEHFLHAVQLAPKDPQTFVALGRHYQRTRKHAPAVSAFEEALALDPHNADAKRYLEQSQEPSGVTKLIEFVKSVTER